MTPRRVGIGMSVNPDNPQAIEQFATALETAIPYAEECQCWFDNQPAAVIFMTLVTELREVLAATRIRR